MTWPGSTAKQEAVRGASSRLVHWPRRDGSVMKALGPEMSIYDTVGGLIAALTPTIAADGSIQADWTPDPALPYGDTYRYEVTWQTIDGLVFSDMRHLELVRVPLSCPVEHEHLVRLEPMLPRWLAQASIADATAFIQLAWDEVVGRIRAAGHRPSLMTERETFALPTMYLALMRLMNSLARAPDDVWERKRIYYAEQYEQAWTSIGPLKFETPETGLYAGKKQTLPRFRI